MKSRLLTLPLCLWLSACGATPLAPRFVPLQTTSESAVAQSLARPETREERPLVVAVRADAPALVAWDLAGKRLWEVPVQAKSAPLIAGDAVVLQEADGIAVRDAATGKLRIRLDGGPSLVGADGVGSTLAISVAHRERDGSSHGELILVSGSSVRWEKALSQPVGVPALVNGQVMVPWGTQRLSVLSADDGTEQARWAFSNMIVGQAVVDRGRVYVGQLGLLPVDEKLPERQEGKLTLVAPLKRALPGQPPLLRDGYAPVPPPEHASHKVKLDWRPAAGGEPAVEDGAAVYRFYRAAFGVSAERDEVTWARSFEHDLVGSSALAGGALLVDEQGSLRFVNRAGETRMQVALGSPLRVATLRAGGFVPPDSGAALEAPAAGPREQLLALAQLADDQLVPARGFAVRHLAARSEPGITRELIALCTRKAGERTVPLQSACDELAKRDAEPTAVLEGLRLKASFLEGTGEPPVGPLARAAARMQLKQAGPLLLSHVEDPHTAPGALVAIFQALEALEWQAAVPQLERFVRLHHAEPDGSELAPALSSALTVLGNLRAKAARATLEYVAGDDLTVPAIRQNAKDALAVLELPPVKKEEPKKEPPPALNAKRSVPEVQPDPRPYALSASDVQKAFRPIHASLQRCLEADPSKPKSARITMIVAGDGRMEGFVVTPTSLQPCSDALLRTARFPETRLARQHVRQTVYAAGLDQDGPEPRANSAAKSTGDGGADGKPVR